MYVLLVCTQVMEGGWEGGGRGGGGGGGGGGGLEREGGSQGEGRGIPHFVAVDLKMPEVIIRFSMYWFNTCPKETDQFTIQTIISFVSTNNRNATPFTTFDLRTCLVFRLQLGIFLLDRVDTL